MSGTDLLSRTAVRARQSPALFARSAWLVRWIPLLVSGALAIAAVTVMKNDGGGYDMLSATRLTIVFLAVGAAGLLDDPAANVVASTPTPLSFRRGLRVFLGALVLALTWAVTISYVAGTPRALWGGMVMGVAFPIARFTVELTALTLAALVIAAIAGRIAGEDRGGLAAAPGMLAILALLARLPDRWAMLTAPGSARWSDAGRDWALAAVALLIVLAMLSLDPARRRLRLAR